MSWYFPSNSLFSLESVYDDLEEATAAAQSVAAACLSVSTLGAARHGGRQEGSSNVHRGKCSWYDDYLSPHPIYPAHRFRQVFRIPLSLYRTLHDELIEEEPDLQQKANAFGIPGHTSHQKILVTLRRLATGLSFRQLDDMCRMSTESQRQAFALTLKAIYRRFGPVHLNRLPTEIELRDIEQRYADKGFPGCIGAVDCMHLHWKNCPQAYKGQYHNPKDGKLATISCEALCDSDLYCWHWFVGRCGTNNDITVADNSPLFIDIFNGSRKMKFEEGYTINGVKRYWLLYVLADGIYPDWCIFAKPNHAPLNEKESYYSSRQEAQRKDIERFFGVLQGRFKILRHELFEWSDEMVILISDVCVILHNMIVDMHRRDELGEETNSEGGSVDVVGEFTENVSHLLGSSSSGLTNPQDNGDGNVTGNGLEMLLERSSVIKSEDAHRELQSELAKHLWARKGDE